MVQSFLVGYAEGLLESGVSLKFKGLSWYLVFGERLG